MSESEPKAKTPRDPAALSPEYHKARKQLMLWAGILFIWELVGIDLEKAKEAGGNAGAIITAVKSPQAVPWVLLILVGYFLFKVTVEWYQCSHARRALRVARVDFISAWIVSLMAYVLYVGQTVRRVQFANLPGWSRLLSFLGLFPLGVFAGVAILLLRVISTTLIAGIDQLIARIRKMLGLSKT